MSERAVERSSPLADDDVPPRRPLWPVVLAAGIVVATVAVAGAITWQAFDGADDTTPALETSAAAEGLAATLATDELAGCPMGDGLLGQVATALGGDDLAVLVADGDVTVERSIGAPVGSTGAASVTCAASSDGQRLGVTVSPSPADAVVVLRAEPGAPAWDGLGSANGGSYLGRCGGDDGCAVLWYDDRLLAMIEVTGPAAGRLDVEQVQAVLAAALPTVIGALAT